jgi:hypothetical protein
MNDAHAFVRIASTGSIRAALRAGAKPASNPEATATLSAITIREGRTFSSMPTSSTLTSTTMPSIASNANNAPNKHNATA